MRTSADSSQPLLLKGHATAAAPFMARGQARDVQPLTRIPIQQRFRAGQTRRCSTVSKICFLEPGDAGAPREPTTCAQQTLRGRHR